MQAVKVLSKGQITLVIGKKHEDFIFKKGKTIYDYLGFLPKPDISIEELIEKSIEEAIKDRV